MSHRPHWSYSAISQFLACPLRFYFQRIVGLPQATVSSSLVLGSAVHHALAEFHRGLQAGKSVPKDSLHRAVQEGWQDREQEGEITFKAGESRQDTIDLGIALMEKYILEPPPENILQVEEE